MSERRQLALELALEVEDVVKVLDQATHYVAGHDQATTARDALTTPHQSALRTRLEHASVKAGRAAEWLRDFAAAAATTPPPDGPPVSRDHGPA